MEPRRLEELKGHQVCIFCFVLLFPSFLCCSDIQSRRDEIIVEQGIRWFLNPEGMILYLKKTFGCASAIVFL